MNKIFKSAFVALLAVLGLTLTACVNKYEYDGALAEGSKVYFSKDLDATVEVSFDESSFTVTVNRTDTQGELTVPLTITMSDGSIFTPQGTSVTFADGESTAKLVFTYNPADVEYGHYDDITVTINDESLTSNYGAASYAFKAGKTEWKLMDTSLGKASYRDDIMSGLMSIPNEIWNVEIYESVATPGRYMVKDPYGLDAYRKSSLWSTEDEIEEYYGLTTGVTPNMVVNAQDPNFVWIEEFEMPYASIFGFNMTIISYVDYCLNAKGMTLDAVKAKYPECFGTLEDGVISMPASELIFTRDGELWNYVNNNGLFAIALPGATIGDFSIEADYLGIFTNVSEKPFAVVDTKLGEDASDVKAVVVEGDADAGAVADAIAAGELEGIEILDGQNNVPIADGLEGKLQVVLVVLNGGKVKTVTALPFEYFGGGSPWQTLGIGYYTDDFIVSHYGQEDGSGKFINYDPETYEVEIQESTTTPGVYRIKNAYAPLCGMFGMDGGKEDIIVHAENPAGVYILTQTTGFVGNNGNFSINTYGGEEVEYCVAKFSVTPEQVIAAYPADFGKLENGVITFPLIGAENADGPIIDEGTGQQLMFQGYLYGGDKSWFAGLNGASKIVLPGAPEAVKAQARKAAAATKARHFNRSVKASASKSVSKNIKRQMLRKKASKLIKLAPQAKKLAF